MQHESKTTRSIPISNASVDLAKTIYDLQSAGGNVEYVHDALIVFATEILKVAGVEIK